MAPRQLTGRLLVALAALALLVAGCGAGDGETISAEGVDTADDEDGDSGGGSAEELCDLLEELSEQEEMEIGDPRAQEQIEELEAAAASTQISDEISTIVEKVGELGDLDEDDPEAFGQAFELFLDPEFLLASAAIEEWGVENCDLESGFFSGDMDDGGMDDGGMDEGGSSGGDGGGFDFEFEGGDPVGMSELRDFLEESHGDASWIDAIPSLSAVPGSVTIGGSSDLTADQALEVCQAASEFVFDQDPEAEIEVTVDDATVVVTDGPGGTCEQV